MECFLDSFPKYFKTKQPGHNTPNPNRSQSPRSRRAEMPPKSTQLGNRSRSSLTWEGAAPLFVVAGQEVGFGWVAESKKREGGFFGGKEALLWIHSTERKGRSDHVQENVLCKWYVFIWRVSRVNKKYNSIWYILIWIVMLTVLNWMKNDFFLNLARPQHQANSLDSIPQSPADSWEAWNSPEVHQKRLSTQQFSSQGTPSTSQIASSWPLTSPPGFVAIRKIRALHKNEASVSQEYISGGFGVVFDLSMKKWQKETMAFLKSCKFQRNALKKWKRKNNHLHPTTNWQLGTPPSLLQPPC